MATLLTPGKLKGLRAISNERGVIAALALDQRGILKNAIARHKGSDDVPDSDVTEFKEIVSQVLTKHASAILLDPEYGLPATSRRNGKGLLLAYERSCYDAAPPRMPVVYDHWSVRRMKEASADCIKVLLHYTPFDSKQINDQKQAWVERVGDECRANDITFVLEILGYFITREGERSLAYARSKPQIVSRSVEEFCKPRYSVDLLKIEIPVQMGFVEGTRCFQGERVYSPTEAAEHFRTIDSCTNLPYVYLSAGVSNEQFIDTLDFAAQSGSRFNGVLCGRATWQDGVAVYAQHGPKALENWLHSEGVENIARVNDALQSATPWTETKLTKRETGQSGAAD